MGGKHLRRSRAVIGLVSATALLTALPAQAATATAVSIAAGPLEAALTALAAQTHEQLLYAPELVRGRRAAALAGRYTAEEALRRLLGPADIAVARAGPNVLVLKRRPAEPTALPVADAGGGAPRPFGAEATPRAATPLPAADAPLPGPRTNTPAPGAAAPTVAELLVTGSNIRGARSASPLLVLDRSDIDRSGQTTVADALNVLPQNFSGVGTEGTNSTGADKVGRNVAYGSSVNLRGLGPDATLVLINGRRLAGAGSFGDFSDISTLPTAAVERVELLLDGASAIYGSDAVGGVVNIILRRDYEGAETRVTGGLATRGQPWEAQLAQTFGHRWGTGGVLVSYELRRRDRLSGDDRDFAADADLRPLGGHDQRLTNSHPGNILTVNAAGATVVGWAIPDGQNGTGLRPQDLVAGAANLENQRHGVDLLPRQTLNALYLSADQQLGDRLEISGDARIGYRRFDLALAGSIANITVTRANPFFVAPAGQASESIAYSFTDELGNARLQGSEESLALTLGAKLRMFGDWRSDGYLAFAQEIAETRGSRVLNAFNLQEAAGSVADRPQTTFNTAVDGFFNPFSGITGANSAAVLAFIGSGFSNSRTRDQVMSANLQADGSLFHLPAGAVKLALGGQVRRETLVRVGSNFTSTVAPVPQVGADVHREVAAAFAELRVPLFGPDNLRPGLERLELSFAERVERYSDVGSTANPKAGVLWQPAQGLTVRGTWGRSFRAPALREVDDAETYSGSLLPLGTARVRTLLLSGGNPDLRPQTAISWTVGADLAPTSWPGVRLSATWFDVDFRNRIGKPVQDNILNALSDPNLASFITRISPTTNAADRTLIAALLANPATLAASAAVGPDAYGAIADNRYVNTAGLHVSGLDLSGAWRIDLGADSLALAASGTWMRGYKQQVTPSATVVDLAGVANFPVRVRGRATADWTRGPVTLGGALNYIAGYKDALGAHIGAQPTVDLQLRRAPSPDGPLRGLTATLNVRNLFDRAPPFYDNIAGVAYDPANADPIGRFVSVQLTRAW